MALTYRVKKNLMLSDTEWTALAGSEVFVTMLRNCVQVDLSNKDEIGVPDEIEDWLAANSNNLVFTDNVEDSLFIYFASDTDVAKFKLFWDGRDASNYWKISN